jgi:hypothetical protein
MRTVTLTLALCLSSLASAVVWRSDADPKAALALAASIPAVGRVLPDGSATLIAPAWVITAAHVAADLKPGSELEFGGKRFAVAEVFIHPQGQPDPARPHQPPQVDIALLRLATPVAGITPLALHRGRAELGQPMAIVGCGDFGPAGSNLAHQDGRCRAVMNRVADAGPMRLFFPFDAPPAGEALEGIGAPGDSGGSALVQVDGKWQVAGVSSAGDGPPNAYGSTDVFARVSSQLEWLDATLARP